MDLNFICLIKYSALSTDMSKVCTCYKLMSPILKSLVKIIPRTDWSKLWQLESFLLLLLQKSFFASGQSIYPYWRAHDTQGRMMYVKVKHERVINMTPALTSGLLRRHWFFFRSVSKNRLCVLTEIDPSP